MVTDIEGCGGSGSGGSSSDGGGSRFVSKLFSLCFFILSYINCLQNLRRLLVLDIV